MAKSDYADEKEQIFEPIKNGIGKLNIQKEKRGRPTLIKSKGDPLIVSKAVKLREQGLSWSEIGLKLQISRSSARRLVLLYQKDEKVYQNEVQDQLIQNYQTDKKHENKGSDDDLLLEDEIFENLPYLYQKFIQLLRQSREMG